MKMKKISSVLLSVLLLLSLSACGGSGVAADSLDADNTRESSTPEPSSEATVLSERAANTASSDTGGIALDENGMINVNITVGNQVFAAKFYDSELAWTIVSKMPFTFEMDDYASQEKVTSLNFELPSASTATPATINAGDIYLWSGNSLVLFYTTFSNSYSYVPVGHIVDVAGLTDALGRGSVTVDFQIAE